MESSTPVSTAHSNKGELDLVSSSPEEEMEVGNNDGAVWGRGGSSKRPTETIQRRVQSQGNAEESRGGRGGGGVPSCAEHEHRQDAAVSP